MDAANPRFSCFDHLLYHALKAALGRRGHRIVADTVGSGVIALFQDGRAAELRAMGITSVEVRRGKQLLAITDTPLAAS